MNEDELQELSWDAWDEHLFPRPGPTGFDRVVEAMTRRGFLGGAIAAGSVAALGAGAGPSMAREHRFPFAPVPIHTDATVHVPEGYDWSVLVRWGDPLFPDAPAVLDMATGGDAASADRVFGENNDGMFLFEVDGRQLLAVNHETANPRVNLVGSGGVVRSADDVRKLQGLQGVTVMEVARGPDGWGVVLGSSFNRRIDHNTPMRLAGPAAGHRLLRTGRIRRA